MHKNCEKICAKNEKIVQIIVQKIAPKLCKICMYM